MSALLVLVVGLALHNLAMALLWQAGVRDTALDVVAAWKDVLLLAALVLALAAGSIPQLFWADRLALAYGGLVVVYAVATRSPGSTATRRREASSTRCATTSCRSAPTSSAASSCSTAPGGAGSA